MKINLLIPFILLMSISLSAQKSDTSLRYDKKTNIVYEDDQPMTMQDLYSVMQPYPEAFKHIEFAKESRVFRTVFSCLSGVPLGYALGHFFFTSEFLWQPVAIGGGLLGIALLFESRTKSQTRQAVDAYNASNDYVYRRNGEAQLGIGFTQHGVGFVLRF